MICIYWFYYNNYRENSERRYNIIKRKLNDVIADYKKALHFYYVCRKNATALFEVSYAFETFVYEDFPDFDKKGPYDTINSFYQFLNGSLEGADYNKDKARITLKECIREIMGYDIKTRCKCFGFNEYCFKNEEEFWECYFYIIDRINPRVDFKDFKNCFTIEMNATGKREFTY